MSKEFIFDFETLGQNTQTCPVIDCSYYIFDMDIADKNEYTFDYLIHNIKKTKFEVSYQVKSLGYKIEPSTLDFWKSQGPAAAKMIAPSKDDVDITTFINNVLKYLPNKRIDHWWSRSNTFDPIILDRLFKDSGTDQDNAALNYRLPFWKVRDTRTFFDAKFNFPSYPWKNAFCPVEDEKAWKKAFVEHNSIHDVAADIMRIQVCQSGEHGKLK